MNSNNPISVIIIEDNPQIRRVFSNYILNDSRFLFKGAYSNCNDAFKEFKDPFPHVVLMDIDLPKMNGIEGTKKVKQLSPETDILIVTVFENSDHVFAALCAGASGYLTKNIEKEELLSSIVQCVNGGAPMSMKIARMIIQSFNKAPQSPLNERETEILTALSEGKSYNSIAEELFITKDTVKYHTKKIYAKLGATNKENAIQIANKKRFI
jgi:DNA-binding NarL/FixJ family response regulator